MIRESSIASRESIEGEEVNNAVIEPGNFPSSKKTLLYSFPFSLQEKHLTNPLYIYR